ASKKTALFTAGYGASGTGQAEEYDPYYYRPYYGSDYAYEPYYRRSSRAKRNVKSPVPSSSRGSSTFAGSHIPVSATPLPLSNGSEDQVYSAVAAMDVDGCGMRFICELQQMPLHQLQGEERMLLQVFGSPNVPSYEDLQTPKGVYLYAAWVGASGQRTCEQVFNKCKVSGRDMLLALRKDEALLEEQIVPQYLQQEFSPPQYQIDGLAIKTSKDSQVSYEDEIPVKYSVYNQKKFVKG
ncbi:unnamed protein product, partial [Meganyctiphanes norvegica]